MSNGQGFDEFWDDYASARPGLEKDLRVNTWAHEAACDAYQAGRDSAEERVRELEEALREIEDAPPVAAGEMRVIAAAALTSQEGGDAQ